MVRRLVVVGVIPALAGAVLIGVALASRQGPAQAPAAVPAHLAGQLSHPPGDTFISPLNTQDTSGVMHVEEIAVVFGRAPRRIPRSYDFPRL